MSGVVQHALLAWKITFRSRIIGIRIVVLNTEVFLLDYYAGKRKPFTEFGDMVGPLKPVHERLVLDVPHCHNGSLQPAIGSNPNGRQDPFLVLYQLLMRILGAELRIRELREEKLLLLRLVAIRHLSHDGPSGVCDESSAQQHEFKYAPPNSDGNCD
jgi:hypothetical protein